MSDVETIGFEAPDPEVRELARVIFDVPRDRCAPTVIDLVRDGVSYRQLLAGALMAAARPAEAHHEVYAIHSTHQLVLDSVGVPWITPVLWAIDKHKRAQEVYPSDSRAPVTGSLPKPDWVDDALSDAMNARDERDAVLSLVQLARTRGPARLVEVLCLHGARDWGFIGHKMIGIVNAIHVVQTLGWRYLEPMLGFAVHQLIGVQTDAEQDRIAARSVFDANRARGAKAHELPADWARAGSDASASVALVETIREGDPRASSEEAWRLLERGRPAGAVWDGVHLGAAELMLRNREGGYKGEHGLVTRPLHANTLATAFHDAFEFLAPPDARALMLLQAVAWVTEMTRLQGAQGDLRDSWITDLEEQAEGSVPSARELHEVFDVLPAREHQQEIPTRSAHEEAARLAFRLGRDSPEMIGAFRREAIRWLARKGTDNAHDFKFPAAIFAEFDRAGPPWLPHMLATSVQWLHGPQTNDSLIFELGLTRFRGRLGLRSVLIPPPSF